MAGPLVWWANRKSKLGLSPIAKEPPPKTPGKPWWTDPPTTLPQPEFIEYVAEFQRQLLTMPGSEKRNAMNAHVAAWLRAARRLLHEEMFNPDRRELGTTDGLLIAADDALSQAIVAARRAGVVLDQFIIDVNRELQRRCTSLRRERAIASSKTVSRPYWGPDEEWRRNKRTP